jgi:serine protease inhibitor
MNDDAPSQIRANAAFRLNLFRELAEQSDDNLIVGPYSVWTALAMVYAGAPPVRGAPAYHLGVEVDA